MKFFNSLLLWAVVLAIPFNDLPVGLNIGELSSEATFYIGSIYILSMSIRVLADKINLVSELQYFFRFYRVYFAFIALSGIFAFDVIDQNFFGGRQGWSRYIGSVGTVTFYFLLGASLHLHGRAVSISLFLPRLISCFRVLGFLLLLINFVELVSWWVPSIRDALIQFRSGFTNNPKIIPFRLYGVSLEPSFNAVALLTCIPFVWVSAAKNHVDRILLLCLLLVLALTGARTGWVGLGMMALFAISSSSRLPSSFRKLPLVGTAIGVIFCLGVLTPWLAYQNLDALASVSNITRSYLASLAVSSGLDRITGQGFGQTAFYLMQHATSTITRSWELLDYYQDKRYGELPPVFSWYARSFSEFGVVGYCAFAFIFAATSQKLARMTLNNSTSKTLYYAAILMLGQFLGVAFSVESIRVPQFWLAWVLIGLSIASNRDKRNIAEVTNRRREF